RCERQKDPSAAGKKSPACSAGRIGQMGAVVDDIAVYETQAVDDAAHTLITKLKEGSVDLVTFTSSSTVKNFYALLPPDSLETLMKDVSIASIGPITADTARDLGFKVDIIAESYTIPGLCEAIQQYYND
ncbi:MAG: uroporphyrinogen-III synthase, partial [Desulfobacteraceae bacterium]|nr:uroporphyrinogen-III synthase [Desulfobacteraceae bacterium]